MNSTSDRGGAATLAAALLTVLIWGFNFTVIKVGVAGVPPLLLACLRFAFSAFPAVLFVRRPDAPWRLLAGYGLLLGVGQFSLLFMAMKLGAPAGLSSIILQSQAFFTAALAAAYLGERIRLHNVAGMLVAGSGLLVFALSGGGDARALTLPLTAMLLGAAFFWAAANVAAKKMPRADGFGLVVWSSLFSPLPLLGLSLAFEGPQRIASALAGLSARSLGAQAYLVLASTIFGYGVWNRPIVRHGAGRIAPFSLLVPVFGVSSAALVLGERFTALDAAASVLVLGGVAVHVFGGRLSGRRA
jgi:O-acetylserine/cysteine efflux transporter